MKKFLMKSLSVILGLLSLGLVLISCGTEEITVSGETQTQLKRVTGLPVDQYPLTYTELNSTQATIVDNFENYVLGEDNLVSPERQSLCSFNTKVINNDETVLVASVQNASDWSTFYWIVKYNPDKYNPKEIVLGKFFGNKQDNLILQRLDRKGVVIFGIARRNPGKFGLLSGSGVIAEIVFKNSPFHIKYHDVPEPEKEDLPRVINAKLVDQGSGSVLISFNEYLPTDFNGNGIVDLPDMGVIAAYYNLRVSGNENLDPNLKFLDISKDGLVEYADFDPIVRSLGLRIEGFRIYRDTDRRTPSPDDAYLPALVTDAETSPLKYSLKREVLEPPTPLNRPEWQYLDTQGYNGDKDTRPELVYRIVTYPEVTGKLLPITTVKLPREPLGQMKPVWLGKPGIIKATASNKQILISFGKAKAPEGVKYRLYYTFADSPQKNGAFKIDDIKSPYVLGQKPEERLVPNKEYKLLVVAYRADKPHVESTNAEWTKVLLAYDDLTDIEPPTWMDRIGVYSGVAGNGAVRLNYGIAIDSQSMPVTYRIYYSTKGIPDPAVDDFIETNSAGSFVIDSLKNGTKYTFMVRALDSAVPSNEDSNTRTITLMPSAEFEGNIDAPRWVNSAQAGAYRVVAGNGEAMVYFGKAQSSVVNEPVKYKIYYSEGAKPNFKNHNFVIVEKSPATISGLSNNKLYTIWVTAIDKDGIENTTTKFLPIQPEDNNIMISLPRFPGDNPQLVVREENHKQLLSWQPAVANGAVIKYKVYWTEGKVDAIDYREAENNNQFVIVSVPRLVLNKILKAGKTYTLAVKAIVGKLENNSQLSDNNENVIVFTMPGLETIQPIDQTSKDSDNEQSSKTPNNTSKLNNQNSK